MVWSLMMCMFGSELFYWFECVVVWIMSVTIISNLRNSRYTNTFRPDIAKRGYILSFHLLLE